MYSHCCHQQAAPSTMRRARARVDGRVCVLQKRVTATRTRWQHRLLLPRDQLDRFVLEQRMTAAEKAELPGRHLHQGFRSVWEGVQSHPRLGHLHQGLPHHRTRVRVAGEGQQVSDRPLSSSLVVPSPDHGWRSEHPEMKKVAGQKLAVLHQPHLLGSHDAIGLDGGDLIEEEVVHPPKPSSNPAPSLVCAFSAAAMRCSSDAAPYPCR
ncbi:hypothetical protein GW17_00011961 [Ensete ventricosum]|nr:hypothetical protein GW17_00011961 [Ensete ventricosum]